MVEDALAVALNPLDANGVEVVLDGGREGDVGQGVMPFDFVWSFRLLWTMAHSDSDAHPSRSSATTGRAWARIWKYCGWRKSSVTQIAGSNQHPSGY
jgi:hypothetical protein